MNPRFVEFHLNPATVEGTNDMRVTVNPAEVSSVFSTEWGTCIVVGGKAHDVVEDYDDVLRALMVR